MSPREAPATIHELSRVGLFAGLPGELVGKIAQAMRREEVAAGKGVIVEGEDGDRFYVLLQGMLGVSTQGMGGRGVLRPGDYFGEVSLAMNVPRTASVHALTPSVVASCDRAAFDELVRPLFADD
ncbi:MAG: cyclic nucleotide-binding domain-containing protein [Gaiellaceae bacterium]